MNRNLAASSRVRLLGRYRGVAFVASGCEIDCATQGKRVHTLHYGTRKRLSMIAEALEQWFDARQTCLTSVDVGTPFADPKGSREHQSARFMGDTKNSIARYVPIASVRNKLLISHTTR